MELVAICLSHKTGWSGAGWYLEAWFLRIPSGSSFFPFLFSNATIFLHVRIRPPARIFLTCGILTAIYVHAPEILKGEESCFGQRLVVFDRSESGRHGKEGWMMIPPQTQ